MRYDLGGLRAEVVGLSGRITALERFPICNPLIRTPLASGRRIIDQCPMSTT